MEGRGQYNSMGETVFENIKMENPKPRKSVELCISPKTKVKKVKDQD